MRDIFGDKIARKRLGNYLKRQKKARKFNKKRKNRYLSDDSAGGREMWGRGGY
jgi:hypothetical protein